MRKSRPLNIQRCIAVGFFITIILKKLFVKYLFEENMRLDSVKVTLWKKQYSKLSTSTQIIFTQIYTYIYKLLYKSVRFEFKFFQNYLSFVTRMQVRLFLYAKHNQKYILKQSGCIQNVNEFIWKKVCPKYIKELHTYDT